MQTEREKSYLGIPEEDIKKVLKTMGIIGVGLLGISWLL